jgi:hypothetical protein
MRRRERIYFFILGIACCAAVSLQVWLLPIVAFLLLEAGYTAVELGREAGGRRRGLPAPVPLRTTARPRSAGRADRAA